MPATSFNGECLARRSASERAGSPSKSRMKKSSSVLKHLAEVIVAVNPNPQPGGVEPANLVQARQESPREQQGALRPGRARRRCSACRRAPRRSSAACACALHVIGEGVRGWMHPAPLAQTPVLPNPPSARCSSAVRRPSTAALRRYQPSIAAKNGGGTWPSGRSRPPSCRSSPSSPSRLSQSS